jgi:hypothetical protein
LRAFYGLLADFPKELPGFCGPDLPYISSDHCSVIFCRMPRGQPMRSYLIATGLASSLIAVWIALVRVVA